MSIIPTFRYVKNGSKQKITVGGAEPTHESYWIICDTEPVDIAEIDMTGRITTNLDDAVHAIRTGKTIIDKHHSIDLREEINKINPCDLPDLKKMLKKLEEVEKSDMTKIVDAVYDNQRYGNYYVYNFNTPDYFCYTDGHENIETHDIRTGWSRKFESPTTNPYEEDIRIAIGLEQCWVTIPLGVHGYEKFGIARLLARQNQYNMALIKKLIASYEGKHDNIYPLWVHAKEIDWINLNTTNADDGS